MVEVNDHLRKEGRSTKAELILPLPGETKESFIKGLNEVINEDFSVSVNRLPVVDSIAMNTFPYSGVLTTPRLVSNEPPSPPKTETDFVFGKYCFVYTL